VSGAGASRRGPRPAPADPALERERESIARLAARMRAQGLGGCDVAVVLGSGLGAFADRLTDAVAVGFDELADMPRSSVSGHAGRFVAGVLADPVEPRLRERVLVQQGRVHLYEGRAPWEVARSIRAMAQLGAPALVLTNAAGGVRRGWPAGTLMRIEDSLNLQWSTALFPGEAGWASPWSASAGAELERGAARAGVGLERGVYAAMLGPAYETPAEIRMLAGLGVDAVGMSTVLEASAGHACGLAVAGISCITNAAAGLDGERLSHAEVLAAGRAVAESFARLLAAGLVDLARHVRHVPHVQR
jgi:purine-nucleoside phosphorylase